MEWLPFIQQLSEDPACSDLVLPLLHFPSSKDGLWNHQQVSGPGALRALLQQKGRGRRPVEDFAPLHLLSEGLTVCHWPSLPPKVWPVQWQRNKTVIGRNSKGPLLLELAQPSASPDAPAITSHYHEASIASLVKWDSWPWPCLPHRDPAVTCGVTG